ncbi:metal-binding protein [Longimycelium tulufanense]|uniref:Metal-binding protein n=1 Tax=Longimycelium tulufanense TaxID=907463 RepID=A0A8J3CFP0_9PSEU|nr:heavy metal-associated domain-containing protein [Longimycelium tulufanense]GGM60567.1 metal-binding protein [Longimycelium tulufanense]
MPETIYTVSGMTCGHCANAVTREISRIEGVHKVDVDVASGRVVVATVADLSSQDVRAAVTEAGYDLVGN